MSTMSAAIPLRTIGIDLGDRDSNYCILDQAGAVVAEGRVQMDSESMLRTFPPEPGTRIVIEASAHSRWVTRCLQSAGHEVIVANPRHMAMISQNERKNDRNDARLLARVARVDANLLRPVAHRSENSFHARAKLAARNQLVRARTRLINFVRAESKVVGSRIPKCCTSTFHKRAHIHVPASLRATLEPLLELIERLHEHILSFDREVERLCKEEFPQTRLLRQVSGVGPILALTYVATIDDPKRFLSVSTWVRQPSTPSLVWRAEG